MNKKILLLLLFVFLYLFSFESQAGVHSSTASSAQGTGNASGTETNRSEVKYLSWRTNDDGATTKVSFDNEKIKGYKAGAYGLFNEGTDPKHHPSVEANHPYAYLAWSNNNSWPNGGDGRHYWLTWSWLTSKTSGNNKCKSVLTNGAGTSPSAINIKNKLTDPYLLKEVEKNKFKENSSYKNFLYTKMNSEGGTNGNTGLDLVWIEKTYSPDYETKTVLTSVTMNGPGDYTGTDIFNYTDPGIYTAEWLWNHAPTTARYCIKTQLNNVTETDTISGTYVILTHYRWKCDQNGKYVYKNPYGSDPEGGYDMSDTKSLTSRTFTYKTETPPFESVLYKPFDFNRNDVISAEDEAQLPSIYPDYDLSVSHPALNLTVDNGQNITDGSPIQTLDTNTGTSLQLKFNNHNFGLYGALYPTNPFVDGATITPDITDDEKSNNQNLTLSEGSTLKGSQRQLVSQQCAWNPTFKFSVSGGEFASLTINDAETKGSEGCVTINQQQAPLYENLHVYFKTIKTGDYNLTNGSTRPYWEASYTQGMLYGYGMTYSGVITLNGISDPTIVDSNHYVNTVSKNVTQPIAKGKIKAKTVGGNISD